MQVGGLLNSLGYGMGVRQGKLPLLFNLHA